MLIRSTAGSHVAYKFVVTSVHDCIPFFIVKSTVAAKQDKLAGITVSSNITLGNLTGSVTSLGQMVIR